MLILEKPYVSQMLVNCAVRLQIPVLRNEMSEHFEKQGYKLKLEDDKTFTESYLKTGKLYSVSENALGWVYSHLASSELIEKINIVKNKALFRKICSKLYPDFFFKEVSIDELNSIKATDMHFPIVIKPSVGFLSVGVYIVRNINEWNKALTDIHDNFETECKRFPSSVIQSNRFLLEKYVQGDEFAVDAYFDSESKPVILNIFHHCFVSETDVSDRLYTSSKAIFDCYLNSFTSFLTKINSVIGLHDFPVHIEFRANKNSIIPLEINPLRFAGMCLNELLVHINGVHPVEAFLKRWHPDYEKMWHGKETDSFSFVVLDKPISTPDNAELDFDKLSKEFSCILETRKIEKPNFGVFGLMFVKTLQDRQDELNHILQLHMNDFVK